MSDLEIYIVREHGVTVQRIGRTVAGAFVIERKGVPLIPRERDGTRAHLAQRLRASTRRRLRGGLIRGVGEEAELIAH